MLGIFSILRIWKPKRSTQPKAFGLTDLTSITRFFVLIFTRFIPSIIGGFFRGFVEGVWMHIRERRKRAKRLRDAADPNNPENETEPWIRS